MPKSIISKNDLLKEQIVERFSSKMITIQDSLLDEIFRLIDNFDTANGMFTGGMMDAEQLLKLQDAINTTLQRSGYIQETNLFMQDFGKVTLNTGFVLEGGGYAFKKIPLSDIEKKWKQQTATTLLDSGINEDFKRPILKILDDAISYGDSINSAKTKLEDFIKGGKDKSGRLQSYVTQTARDSISQMQGQQFQSVANEIGVAGVLYTGGLLKDSRGQCTHWIKDLNGFIPNEKLKHEIKQAYANQAAKKITDGVHKWGGMMPNTDETNFYVKRGGFNCTHTAIPKRKK